MYSVNCKSIEIFTPLAHSMSKWEVCIVLYKTYQSKVHEYECMRHLLIYLRMSSIITKDKCVHNSGCVRFWDLNENTVLLSEQIEHWKRLIWKVCKSGALQLPWHSCCTDDLKNMFPLHITKFWEVTTFYVSPISSANFLIYPSLEWNNVLFGWNSHKFFFLRFLRYIDPMLYFYSILAHLSWNLKWACLIAFCSSSVCQSIRPFVWM